MACGFAGNADIYGVGIRIGYYSQALAVWFANFFYFREAQVLRGVNNLFLFALVVAGCIYAANASNVYAVEAFLMLQIGLVIGFVGIMNSTRYSTKYISGSRERLISRTVVINAGLVFNILFWWRGLDVMRPTSCFDLDNSPSVHTAPVEIEQHNTYVLYVWKVNMYGWFRTVMRFACLAAWLWTTCTTTAHDSADVVQKWRMRSNKMAFVKAASEYSITAAKPNELFCCPDQMVEKGEATQITSSETSKADIRKPADAQGSCQPPVQEANEVDDDKGNAKKSPPTTLSVPNQPFVAVHEKKVVLESIFSI